MRILFCDDDPVIVSQLEKYIREFFAQFGSSQPEIACYQSGDTLIQNESRADIAFLDVEMPGISGIHVGAKLKAINPKIKIFIVTAYPDYLDEAMRFQVFRYLSKPIDKTRLFRNLKDAIHAINMESGEFSITTYDGVYTRSAEQIVYVETFQRKTLVHTLDETFTSQRNMDYWRKKLSLPCFFSTHRSFIINMRFVYHIGKDSVQLRYQGQSAEVFLSRRRYTEFKNTYLVYLEGVR